jgi:hypothetical protein
VSAHWRAPAWRVAYTVAGDHVGELHKLSVYLWNAMAPYETGRDRKMLMLIVEEMDLSVPNHRLPRGSEGFKQLTLQGRHRGIEIIGVTQHPAQVPVWFRISCPERYVFAVGLEDHGIMGTRYRDQVAALTTHHYLRFDQGGQVTHGENRLSRGSPASSRRRVP